MRNPYTGETVTPQEAASAYVKALREADSTRAWVWRRAAGSSPQHFAAMMTGEDEHRSQVAKPAGAYLPGEIAP